MGHSCTSVLWDTLAVYTCRTLLWDTLVGDYYSLQKSTVTSPEKAFPTRLQRDFLNKTSSKTNQHVESAKRAFGTRLPPKFTCQSSRTSVSYETSSKTKASSLQNERFARDFLQKSRASLQNKRFVRDFLQKSHVKVSKTNISHKTSSKSRAGSHRSTHIKQPCQAVSRLFQ